MMKRSKTRRYSELQAFLSVQTQNFNFCESKLPLQGPLWANLAPKYDRQPFASLSCGYAKKKWPFLWGGGKMDDNSNSHS